MYIKFNKGVSVPQIPQRPGSVSESPYPYGTSALFHMGGYMFISFVIIIIIVMMIIIIHGIHCTNRRRAGEKHNGREIDP